jgi:hypothetical protein
VTKGAKEKPEEAMRVLPYIAWAYEACHANAGNAKRKRRFQILPLGREIRNFVVGG